MIQKQVNRLRIGIDNPIETLTIQCATDYTTLRVLENTSLSIERLFRNGHAVINEKNDAIFFCTTGYRWSSGKAISPKSWLDGIHFALDHNHILKSLAVDIGLRFSIVKNGFMAASSIPAQDLADFLFVRVFSPFDKEEGFSGAYCIANVNADWKATPNPCYSDAKMGDVLYKLVRDPYQAVELFTSMALDKTPETFLPLEMWKSSSPYLQFCDSDLVGYVSFSVDFVSTTSARDRKSIHREILSMPMPREFEGRWLPILPLSMEHDESKNNGRIGKGVITLSYDEVYPNREYSLSIARAIEKLGVRVIVKGSAYDTCADDWDVKFHISHFFGLPQHFRKAICQSSNASFSYIKDGEDLILEKLDDNYLSFPVCAIPLCFFDRSNDPSNEK